MKARNKEFLETAADKIEEQPSEYRREKKSREVEDKPQRGTFKFDWDPKEDTSALVE